MAWPFMQQVLNKIEVAIMVKTQDITLKTQGTIVPSQLLHIFVKSLMNLTKFILTNNFGLWFFFGKKFSISEINILCVEVAKVLWYCKIKKAQSFHTRNPKQNSSLQLWSSYCNFHFSFFLSMWNWVFQRH
jgi:hypothetical protein